MLRTLLTTLAVAAIIPIADAQITDLTAWSLVEDPADPFFDASVDGPSSITLSASDATGVAPGSIPNATDIGYQSVDGSTVADSTSGYAFRRGQSFALAVDYDADIVDASGGLSFGFGIGLDRAGVNSAGVAMITQGGVPVTIPLVGPAGAGATVDDVPVIGNLSPAVSSAVSSLEGSFHVAYDASTGDITVGRGDAGALAPLSTFTFSAGVVTDQWAGGDLLASFFIRSDTVDVPFLGTVSTPWTDGSAAVRFSGIRVSEGQAYHVPSPGALGVLALGPVACARRRRR